MDLLKQLGEHGLCKQTQVFDRMYETGEWSKEFHNVTMSLQLKYKDDAVTNRLNNQPDFSSRKDSNSHSQHATRRENRRNDWRRSACLQKMKRS